MENKLTELNDERAYLIYEGVARQAVHDAGAALRQLYRNPDNQKAWSTLKYDIIPYFNSDRCFAGSHVMMKLTIEQEMRLQGMTEMPAVWQKALALAMA